MVKKSDFNKNEKNNHKQNLKNNTKIFQNKSKKVFFFKNIGQKYIGFKILNKVFKYMKKRQLYLRMIVYLNLVFLDLCDLMLKKYHLEKNIAHISGCNLYYGTSIRKITKGDYLFSKYPHFCGWATWKV